jgi:hypothetical protein
MQRAVLLIAFLILTAGTANAQTVSDEKLWLSATGEFDLSRATQLGLTASMRSGADSGLDQLRAEVQLDHRLTHFFEVGGAYYLTSKDGNPRLDTRDEVRHRLLGQGTLRVRPDRFELSYRLRLQYTTYEFDDDHFHVRNKFKAGYAATKHVTPYAALEFIYLTSPKSEYRETRFYLGVDWRFRKRTELGIYYLRQVETNVNTPEENNVLGVGITYTFKHVKRPDDEVSGTDPD